MSGLLDRTSLRSCSSCEVDGRRSYEGLLSLALFSFITCGKELHGSFVVLVSRAGISQPAPRGHRAGGSGMSPALCFQFNLDRLCNMLPPQC